MRRSPSINRARNRSTTINPDHPDKRRTIRSPGRAHPFNSDHHPIGRFGHPIRGRPAPAIARPDQRCIAARQRELAKHTLHRVRVLGHSARRRERPQQRHRLRPHQHKRDERTSINTPYPRTPEIFNAIPDLPPRAPESTHEPDDAHSAPGAAPPEPSSPGSPPAPQA